MDARILRGALIATAFLSLGASHRTANFIVSAPTARLAAEIAQKAEKDRRELSIEWLGHELPRWQQPCPITAQVGPHLGAGGATSFMFDRGRPFGWRMSIQGSRERLLDSVLPHEVTHTIFATHFGRPLPRWADEGACTTVEHISEKSKQQQNLIRFLTTKRGISFNRMFAMKEYPADILPLYSQGYSVARYLIAQGGKPKFVQYVGDGMRTNNWTSATQKHYGFSSLSDLQVKWLDWVRRGSRPISPTTMLADAKSPKSAGGNARLASTGGKSGTSGVIYRGQNQDPPKTPSPKTATAPTRDRLAARSQAAPIRRAPASTIATNGRSWYAEMRDRALAARDARPVARKPVSTAMVPRSNTGSHPAPHRQTILEWSRTPRGPVSGGHTSPTSRGGTILR